MATDLRFFTNEPERDLYSRFNVILKRNTQFFDILVGYFRTSGFYKLYPAMQDIEKIRVLVGLSADKKTLEIIQKSQREVKEDFSKSIAAEFRDSEDISAEEQGVRIFIEWLRCGKIEMRMFPEAPLHAKVYITRKNEQLRDEYFGSVITGSSNFSAAGLSNNLEFNVELKDRSDVDFALEKFNDLWNRSVDISDVYIETIERDTWLRNDITPYELYLKTLYEYFLEEINIDQEAAFNDMLPEGFMRLQYQLDAVIEAEKKLKKYNGVFISDVVGLGKTYICAMLAKRMKGGRKLFICPPVIVDYWRRVLIDFDVAADVESLGKLDRFTEADIKKYSYVFVDEAHRFRNDDTESYAVLHEICKGKKVVLISATPINNYTSDIEHLIYLFQDKRNSTIIPNIKNLQGYFSNLNGKLKKLKRGTKEYSDQMRRNSEDIRDKLLRNIMVRRIRNEIAEYYADDLKEQGLSFPKLGTPDKVIYTFDDDIDEVFTHTVQTIKALKYARYSPIVYLRNPTPEQKKQMTAQTNMRGFMKSILVKRLESSFFAFKRTLGRFIESYEQFIDMYNDGDVYISKKVDVYDLLNNGDDAKLIQLVDEDKAQHFKSDEFEDDFIDALEKDLAMLKRLNTAWAQINTDPRLDEFKRALKENTLLKDKKLIIFTESKETASYLGDELGSIYGDSVVEFSSEGSLALKQEIENSFNPKFADSGKDKYRILITTDVLAEGVNLHRAGVLTNYDLPWNPTRIMQRVGRINRVGTEFDKISVFNFFPTAQSDKELLLEDRILEKLQAFHDTLGEDFKYLSEDEEVTAHKLYDGLTGDMGAEEGGNPELPYLMEIRCVRDEDEALFEKIKRLPRKAKAGKHSTLISDCATVTYLRKGYLKMFFKTEGGETTGISFIDAIKLIQATPSDRRVNIGAEFFDHLAQNKAAFDVKETEEEVVDFDKVSIKGNEAKVIKLLKAISKCKKLVETQEETLRKMIALWENGEIPIGITKDVLKAANSELDDLQLFAEIQNRIPESYLTGQKEKKEIVLGVKQVILSCWLKNEVAR